MDVYLRSFQKSLGTQSDKLYDAGFLKCVRSATANGKVCIRGQCRAEMRKAIIYVVDMVSNLFANIAECQCEFLDFFFEFFYEFLKIWTHACMGPNPHCKHVQCVMYALREFAKHISIRTEETCTQKLQTFHKMIKPRSSWVL